MMHSSLGLTHGMNIKQDEENFFRSIAGRHYLMD